MRLHALLQVRAQELTRDHPSAKLRAAFGTFGRHLHRRWDSTMEARALCFQRIFPIPLTGAGDDAVKWSLPATYRRLGYVCL
jgi:hypothetical protein